MKANLLFNSGTHLQDFKTIHIVKKEEKMKEMKDATVCPFLVKG